MLNSVLRRATVVQVSLALIRHSNRVLEIVLQLADREQIIAAKMLLDARNALAEMLARIDSWMNGGGRPR